MTTNPEQIRGRGSVPAFKPAEDGRAWIVRCFEPAGAVAEVRREMP